MQLNSFCLQDDETFVFILVFVGFKIETDVRINEGSIPIWIFGMHLMLCSLKVQMWCSYIHFFSSKIMMNDSNGCSCKVDEGSARGWLS